MQKRYVLVSDPDRFELTEKFISKFHPEQTKWLSVGQACEFVSANDIHIAADQPIDLFQFPLNQVNRKKNFIFCDMDATILQDETFDALRPLFKKDIADRLSEITADTMEGKINFEDSLRQRVAFLKNIPAEKIEKIGSKMTFNKGAAELVATMKRNGAYCVIISGGFTHITKRVAAKLGFDEDHGNNLVTKEGILTGELSGKIIDAEEKGLIVKRVLQRFGAEREHSLCVGDGANDIRMMKESHFGISFHGKEILKRETKYHINHTSLLSILYAQGFCESDIIRP